jgi:hypothetical protein
MTDIDRRAKEISQHPGNSGATRRARERVD